MKPYDPDESLTYFEAEKRFKETGSRKHPLFIENEKQAWEIYSIAQNYPTHRAVELISFQIAKIKSEGKLND